MTSTPTAPPPPPPVAPLARLAAALDRPVSGPATHIRVSRADLEAVLAQALGDESQTFMLPFASDDPYRDGGMERVRAGDFVTVFRVAFSDKHAPRSAQSYVLRLRDGGFYCQLPPAEVEAIARGETVAEVAEVAR